MNRRLAIRKLDTIERKPNGAQVPSAGGDEFRPTPGSSTAVGAFVAVKTLDVVAAIEAKTRADAFGPHQLAEAAAVNPRTSESDKGAEPGKEKAK